MTITNFDGATAVVELTSDEVAMINNALNEVCNGIDLTSEFDTRMGCSVEEARTLLEEINQLANQIKKST